MSQQQTNQAVIQLQNNAVLIRKSEKVNQKYDEILDLIDAKTAQQFAAIPARFESDSSSPDLDDKLFESFNQSNEKKVSQTESFRTEVIESVEQEEKKGKGWFQAFKDTLSSESIQNKLQGFKDRISATVVKLGNNIASLPEEIATKSVMKTALEKVKEARSLAPPTPQKETYQVGDYQVVASKDNQFSLLDKQGNKLVDFSANNHLKNPSVISKSSEANASQILKEIKDKPVELNVQSAQQRETLINQVSEQIQTLPKGRSIGENNQYTVRAYQGEQYLDNGFGHQITHDDLNSLSYGDLESLSEQFQQEHQQIQAETAMPVFTKILKAHESYEVNSNGSNLEYNPDNQIMTFTSSQGETLKARSLGHGQWEHLDGELSAETIAELKNNLEPQVDRYFEQKARLDQTREVLQTLG